MTKKHFIALADTIRVHNKMNDQFGYAFIPFHLETLADFCQSQNPQFNRTRWLGYIAGTNGKNGGSVKKVPHQKVLHGLCNVCGHYGEDCTGKVTP